MMLMTRCSPNGFVDSFKPELIADRVRRSHALLEFASLEYVPWFNHERLHSLLGGMFLQLNGRRRIRLWRSGPTAEWLPGRASWGGLYNLDR